MAHTRGPLLVALTLAVLPVNADAQAVAQSTVTVSSLVEQNTGAGQTGLSDADDRLRRGGLTNLILPLIEDPGGDSEQASPKPRLTLVATKGDLEGKARLGYSHGPVSYLLNFSAPFRKGVGTFATDRELGANVTVGGSVTWAFWSMRPGIRGEELVRGLQRSAAIRQAIGEEVTLDTLASSMEVLRQTALRVGGSTFRTALQRDAAFSQSSLQALFSDEVIASPARFWGAVAQSPLVEMKPAVFVTPGFEIKRHTIDYLTAETFAPASFDDETRAFTFAAGFGHSSVGTGPFKEPRFYLGVSTRLGSSVKAGDVRRICSPLGESGSLECFDRPVGVPVPADVRTVTAEFRFWQPLDHLGINPKFTWDDVKGVKTFEVPIYFLRLAKSLDDELPLDVTAPDLTGGLNIGWRSDGKPETKSNGPFIALFLSTAFEW